MRIIAGEFRHRKLFSPPDTAPTRPIPDRVKEAMFNLLRGWTEGATVLDVFAGSGAIGLEAVSRGASSCTFFERDRRVAELLQRNIDHLGCADRCEVIRADALGPALLTRGPRDVDLMFFDPPYALVDELEGWNRVKLQFTRAMGLMKPKSFAILRTPWPFKHFIPDEPDAERVEEGRHGGRGRARHGRRDEEESDERIWEGEELRELEESGFDEAALYGEEGEDGDDDMGEDGVMDDDAASSKPAGRWVAADLNVAGTQGPETHVYGSTAVHLYMPAPGGA